MRSSFIICLRFSFMKEVTSTNDVFIHKFLILKENDFRQVGGFPVDQVNTFFYKTFYLCFCLLANVRSRCFSPYSYVWLVMQHWLRFPYENVLYRQNLYKRKLSFKKRLYHVLTFERLSLLRIRIMFDF